MYVGLRRDLFLFYLFYPIIFFWTIHFEPGKHGMGHIFKRSAPNLADSEVNGQGILNIIMILLQNKGIKQ